VNLKTKLIGKIMNPRQRALTALNHQVPDRLPLELGGAGITSASDETQQRLRQALGLTEPADPRFPYFDDGIQKALGIDFRAIYQHGLPERHFRADGTPVDGWGVASYHNAHDNPLRYASRDDLQKVKWPDPDDPRRYAGLGAIGKFLFQDTDYAIVGQHVGHGFFEGGCRLRGYEQFILDCALDQDWVRAFFDILLDLNTRMMDHYLDEVGEFLHVIWLGDDTCTQRGPYISPRLYQQLVKPYFTEYIRRIKLKTNAKIMHHCCGSCYKLLPDFLDIGIEVLNPVQPEALDMDHARLNQEFGERMSFWGGIGMQHTLTHGTTGEVKTAVKEAFANLGPDGGYILAATHTFTEDVPAENILALYEAGRECRY
jgi:uroporphyrinogen decarboxylase